MGLTRISGDVIQTPLNVGVVTATVINVGSAVTIHTSGFQIGSFNLHSSGLDLGSGNITSHNINSTGIITATSFSGDVTGNITGNLTGNVNSSGISTFTTLKVGTAITISSGIISATSFYGDGTNLTNTGSTLSAASGSQRVVLTGQTSGTMTASATDSALTYTQSTGTLSATKFSGDGSSLTGISFSVNSQTTAYVLVADDIGKLISITTGGVTVPQNIFSAGQNISIYNNSSSSQTITQGTGVTLRLSGTLETGNRTLQQRGIASVLCVASNEFIITGTGLL